MSSHLVPLLLWWWRNWRHRRERAVTRVGALGAVPSRRDDRDYPARIFASTAPDALPPVAAVGGQSPVRDQGAWNSCVAHAVTAAMECLVARQLWGGTPFLADPDSLSPMFVWYEGRSMEGTVGQNVGMQIRDAVQVVAGDGACSEEQWRYDALHLDQPPTEPVLQDAAGRKVTLYLRVNSLEELKQSIADGYPVVLGFKVFPASFGPAGQVGAPLGDPAGWHAVLAIGYNDATQIITFKNSWGTAWGRAGYGTLPYSYVANPELVSDMWALRVEDVPDKDAILAKWVAQEVAAKNENIATALALSERGKQLLARAAQLEAEATRASG